MRCPVTPELSWMHWITTISRTGQVSRNILDKIIECSTANWQRTSSWRSHSIIKHQMCRSNRFSISFRLKIQSSLWSQNRMESFNFIRHPSILAMWIDHNVQQWWRQDSQYAHQQHEEAQIKGRPIHQMQQVYLDQKLIDQFPQGCDAIRQTIEEIIKDQGSNCKRRFCHLNPFKIQRSQRSPPTTPEWANEAIAAR